jgi:hypothetical protein
VGSIMNFSLMYLLAPTGSAAASTGGGFISRALSEQTLKGWGAPGERLGHRGTCSGSSAIWGLPCRPRPLAASRAGSTGSAA